MGFIKSVIVASVIAFCAVSAMGDDKKTFGHSPASIDAARAAAIDATKPERLKFLDDNFIIDAKNDHDKIFEKALNSISADAEGGPGAAMGELALSLNSALAEKLEKDLDTGDKQRLREKPDGFFYDWILKGLKRKVAWEKAKGQPPASETSGDPKFDKTFDDRFLAKAKRTECFETTLKELDNDDGSKRDDLLKKMEMECKYSKDEILAYTKYYGHKDRRSEKAVDGTTDLATQFSERAASGMNALAIRGGKGNDELFATFKDGDPDKKELHAVSLGKISQKLDARRAVAAEAAKALADRHQARGKGTAKEGDTGPHIGMADLYTGKLDKASAPNVKVWKPKQDGTSFSYESATGVEANYESPGKMPEGQAYEKLATAANNCQVCHAKDSNRKTIAWDPNKHVLTAAGAEIGGYNHPGSAAPGALTSDEKLAIEQYTKVTLQK